MGYWKIIKPAATTNYISNPRGGTAAYWSVDSDSTVAKSYDYGRFGVYSIKAVYGTAVSPPYVAYTETVALPAGNYVFSVYLLSDDVYSGDIIVLENGSTQLADVSFALSSGRWQRIEVPFTISTTSTSMVFRIRGTAGGTLYIDGLQLEVSPMTTYVDGDETEGQWVGEYHDSHSYRLLTDTTEGGQVLDFADDLSINIYQWTGVGMPDTETAMTKSPTMVGAAWWQTRVKEREFVLIGLISATSLPSRHSIRDGLAYILGGVLKIGATVTLVYSGSGQDVYIRAIYEGGFGLNQTEGRVEQFALRFLMPQVLMTEDNEQQAALTLPGSSTAYYAVARLDGKWTDLLQSTDLPIYGLRRGPDGLIYAFGEFTSLVDNLGFTITTDHLAVYNPATDMWARVGDGLDDITRGVMWSPDGTMYFWGDFVQNSSATLTLNRFGYYDGVYHSMDDGFDAPVVDAKYNYATGEIVAVGNFDKANSGTADEIETGPIARWTGAKWETIAPSGAYPGSWDSTISTLQIDASGNIYIGGYFTLLPATAGGTKAAYHVAYNDGTDWYALGNGFDDNVYILVFAPTGELYAGGKFRYASDGTTLMRSLARWTGSRWEETPDQGIDNEVWWLDFDSADNLWLGGIIYRAGTISTTDGVALFNGTTFVPVDIAFKSYASVSIRTKVWDIFVDDWDNVWLALSRAEGAWTPIITTITNQASTPVVPTLYIKGPLALKQLTNWTTGQHLYFDILVADGEWLEVDIANGIVTSSTRGRINNAILAGSDIAHWVLHPGTNKVTGWGTSWDSVKTKMILHWAVQHYSADSAS